MKNLILVLVLLAILFFGYKHFALNLTPLTTNDTQVATSTQTTAFEDGTHSIRLVVPSEYSIVEPSPGAATDWKVNSTSTGFTLVRITVPKETQPGTNFSEAKLTVARSNALSEIKGCAADPYVKGVPAVVNGVNFTKFEFSNAAAGNRYDTTSYHTIHDGDCYVIEYTIHSTNLANYEPSSLIKAFDRDKVVTAMEKIVQSLELLVNSD